MVCSVVKLPNGASAIVCGPRPRSKPCSHPGCGVRHASKLCDWPIGGGKTCDKPLCEAHAVHVGPDTDYCRGHEEPRQRELQL
jgi:hypothetical protein